MKAILRTVAAAALLYALSAGASFAQSGCNIFGNYGYVPTPGQWQQCLGTKQDALGYTAVNKAGDVMAGRLGTTASTTARSGFAIAPGVAPTSPLDGDLWTTPGGLFVRINGSTVGPLTATGSTIPSVVQGDILYGSAPGVLSALAKNTSATRYLSNTGTSNNPAWAQVDLSNGVTGALTLANLPTGTQDTALGYFGSTTASAVAVPNCSGALTYSTSTHTFGCNASGSVLASGTPTVNQLARWTNSNTIQGVNIATIVSAGGGIALSGTTTLTIGLANNGATLSTTASNPTGTTSGTPIMMGLGGTCKITPGYSTRVEIEVYGTTSNTVGGALNGIRLSWGTGTAPANGVAAAGTQVGSTLLPTIPSAGYNLPFKTGAILTGLSAGVQIWFDIQLNTGSGTAVLNALACNAKEI